MGHTKKPHKIRAILLARKPSSCEALLYLKRKGVEVRAVVTREADRKIYGPPYLDDLAKKLRIPVLSEEDLYHIIEKEKSKDRLEFCDVDWVFSYLFWNKAKKSLIRLPRQGCLNFHPAPLPEYRGLGGYNFAIFERSPYWAVSAHFMNEYIDEGDLVDLIKFDIDPDRETAFSLEKKTQFHLLSLFKKVIDRIVTGNHLPRKKQGPGRYIARKDMEELRQIRDMDSPEIIDKKIRAFWFPPYPGALVEIQGKKYTIIDERILAEISHQYSKKTKNSLKM